MSASDTIQARISPQLKREAEAVFRAIGLKTSDAIRLFLQQSVNLGGLPFRLRAKTPNQETLAAMDELKANKGEHFKTSQELFDSWDKP